MRRAAHDFKPSKNDEQDIVALVDRANASTQEATDALDDVIAFIAESNNRIEAMEGAKE